MVSHSAICFILFSLTRILGSYRGQEAVLVVSYFNMRNNVVMLMFINLSAIAGCFAASNSNEETLSSRWNTKTKSKQHLAKHIRVQCARFVLGGQKDYRGILSVKIGVASKI